MCYMDLSKTSPLQNILFIDGGGWNGVTTVQVNVINFFLSKGHTIKVILFDNGIKADQLKLGRWPKDPRIEYRVINQKTFLAKLLNRFSLSRHIYKYVKCVSELNTAPQCYAFDYEAGILCLFQKKLKPSTRYFLHSIELYENTRNVFLVKQAFKNAAYIITQDWVRKERLLELYGLKQDYNILISVNSSRYSDRMDTTRLTFPDHIAKRKKLLFIGSLIDQHCIQEVLETSKNIPEDFCLILHGWGAEKFKDHINQLISMKPDNVWFSDFALDDVTKFRLYSSIDVGLVTFNKRYYNGKYAGLSAGKLYDFMRIGKPVLANDIPGLGEFVRENSIGRVIDDFGSLYKEMRALMTEYEMYAANAKALFGKCEFDLNFNQTYHEFQRGRQ